MWFRKKKTQTCIEIRAYRSIGNYPRMKIINLKLEYTFPYQRRNIFSY